MAELIRTGGFAAVLLTVAVVTGCSATEELAATPREPAAAAQEPAAAAQEAATEDVAETSLPGSSTDAGATAESAAGTGAAAEPADGTGATTERPSVGFKDVPEGYYVVDDGRAMVPERGGAGCEGLPTLEPRTNATEDRVHGYWYSSLRDVGPIDGATGEAIYDEEGQPVAYVAAPGDTISGIAARFCIDHLPYLEWINAIRRGEGTSVLDLPGSMPLHAGDTINLNPHTIVSVGDENGVVRDNAIDFHIPPQH